VRDARAILGDNLLGVYLHGSLAMGCFNPDQSDIDLLAVTGQHMTPDKRRLMAGLLLTLSGAPAPLEVSFLLAPALRDWRHPFPYEFHYSEGWRERFEANLTRLDWQVWTDTEQTDPDLAAHLTILTAKAGVVLYGEPIHEVFPQVPTIDYIDSLLYDFEPARDGIGKDPVYGVLNLLRVFWYLSDGHISSKAEAGRWGAEMLPDAELRDLAAQARAAYAGDVDAVLEFAPEVLRRFAIYVDGQVDRLLPGRLTTASPPQSQPVPECLRCKVTLRFGGIRQFLAE
jgi:streptomycin 3"-adenylyltransferase